MVSFVCSANLFPFSGTRSVVKITYAEWCSDGSTDMCVYFFSFECHPFPGHWGGKGRSWDRWIEKRGSHTTRRLAKRSLVLPERRATGCVEHLYVCVCPSFLFALASIHPYPFIQLVPGTMSQENRNSSREGLRDGRLGRDGPVMCVFHYSYGRLRNAMCVFRGFENDRVFKAIFR